MLTVKGLAKKFGVSKVRVYTWMKSGALKCTLTIDGHAMFPDDTVRPARGIPGRRMAKGAADDK